MQISKIQNYSNLNFDGRLTIADSKGQKREYDIEEMSDKYLAKVFHECYITDSCHGLVPVEKLRPYENILNKVYGMNIPQRSDSLERPVEAYVPNKFYIINAPGGYKITHELYNNRLVGDVPGDYRTEKI